MNNSINSNSIFINGADAFIGSHLAERLVAKHAKVSAMVYYNSWTTKNLHYFDGNTYAK